MTVKTGLPTYYRGRTRTHLLSDSPESGEHLTFQLNKYHPYDLHGLREIPGFPQAGKENSNVHIVHAVSRDGNWPPPATADLTCVRQVRDPGARAIKARELLRVPTVLSHDLKRLAGRTAIDESNAAADDVRLE